MNTLSKSIWALGLACVGLFSTVHADDHDRLIKCIKRGRLEKLKTLINEENANEFLCVDGIEMTPFFLACREAEAGIVLWLMQFKPDVNIEIDGSYPLHEIVKHKFLGLTSFLVAMGADLKREDKRGETPLAIAQRLNHRGLIPHLKDLEEAWTGESLDFDNIFSDLDTIVTYVLTSTLCNKDKFFYLRKAFEMYPRYPIIVKCIMSAGFNIQGIEAVINTLDAETVCENKKVVAFWKRKIEKTKIELSGVKPRKRFDLSPSVSDDDIFSDSE